MPAPAPTHDPASTPVGGATTDAVDVSVVIVNYNVREFLEQALRSVERASAGLSVETWVVDNASVDGSVEMVREQFPEVHVIANEANVGFGAANNQAIRQARGRYVFVLNPDTVLQEDTLRAFVRFMEEHPDCGVAGCRILNPDGSYAPESRRAFPTPEVALYRMLGLSRLFPHSRRFGRYNLSYLPWDEDAEVDALAGCCMFARRAALVYDRETADRLRAEGRDAHDGHRLRLDDRGDSLEGGAGGFDESFFMYGEDLDWSYRFQRAGWKVFYTPVTQIIHYKGESTRKGEIRYVRLFYGAMLQFTDKHFSGQHAPLTEGLIRAGIFARASLSAANRVLSRVRRPALDGAVVWLACTLVGLGWSALAGKSFSAELYVGVLPLYALAAVVGIGLAGGYQGARWPRFQPLWAGLGGAFLFASTVSFLVKSVAHSRVTVVAGFAVAAVALAVVRWAAARRHGPRRAVLVGPAGEARRLRRLLAGHPEAPVRLLGWVGTGGGGRKDRAVPRLGGPNQLRDVVRLQGVDEVVFAADGLTNTAILGHMQALRDLPVQFRIFTEGRDRLIGKASVADLSAPLLDATRLVPTLRSAWARRAFEVPVALLGVLLHPLVRLARRVAPSPGVRRLAAATAKMPSVLAGRRALVGYDTAAPQPPAAWGLRPGVVSILDTLPHRPTAIVEVHRAYWFYARNQCAAFDVQLLLRALAAPAPEWADD